MNQQVHLIGCDQFLAADMGKMLDAGGRGGANATANDPLLPKCILPHLKVCPFRTLTQINKSPNLLLLCFSDADS